MNKLQSADRNSPDRNPVKRALFFAFGLLPFTWLCGGSLDWDAATPGVLPPGWICDGKGEGKVRPSFGGEKHPVVQMDSANDSLALYNYKLASSYKPETLGRCKIQFADLAVGCVNFAMDGGGGRGGIGIYFTKSGTLEVVRDEQGTRAKLLDQYKTDTWYEIRARFSTVEETWNVEIADLSTGQTVNLKGLPWMCPAVREEKAYAGVAVSVWSKATVYVSELEVEAAP